MKPDTFLIKFCIIFVSPRVVVKTIQEGRGIEALEVRGLINIHDHEQNSFPDKISEVLSSKDLLHSLTKKEREHFKKPSSLLNDKRSPKPLGKLRKTAHLLCRNPDMAEHSERWSKEKSSTG